MIDLTATLQIVLQDAGYRTQLTSLDLLKPISFEDHALLGFAIVFEDVSALLEGWPTVEGNLLSRHAAALRRAEEKAWNVYCAFLTAAPASDVQELEIRQIEENLERTRKIAACNLASHSDVVNALLPVLPIQYHPRLESDNLTSRLRQRIASFAPAAADAALDDQVPPADVVKLLGGSS